MSLKLQSQIPYANSTGVYLDSDGDGLNDSEEYYTKVYEYPTRVYISGEKKLWLKWKEEYYSIGVKEAKVIVGIRAQDGSSINVAIYYGNTKLNDATTKSVTYIDASLMKYVGKSERYVRVELNGKGWVESFKVMLVEESDPHKKDTDGDGLSDGYEVKGLGGYMTSPVSRDTDGDGISDRMEEYGWSWKYENGGYEKVMDSNGFHTNPLSKDTDGDGYNDNIDVNPVANLVLRMSLEEYRYYDHPDYTKFAGLWAKWELNGKSDNVVYYTKHRDHVDNLHGYVYWFDVPDNINTEIQVKAGAFYNDLGDKKLGEWSGDFGIKSGYSYWVSESNKHYKFKARFWVYPLGRVHTVAVYNDSVWKYGRYLYDGKYYILYVESDSSSGVIVKGLNIIIVPSSIFVNSELYKKIEDGDISYVKGKDGENAKMGAIGAKNNGVHIVSTFIFRSDASNLADLLNLLVINVSGKRFASYASITPEQANIPDDILSAIPLVKIKNSATGGKPEDLWEQISDTIGGAINSAVNFVANAIIAIGNFIEHAAEVIAKMAMAVFNTVVNAVKAAVEAVKKVVDAVIKWLIGAIKSLVDNYIEPFLNKIKDGIVSIISGTNQSIKEGTIDSYYYTHILPMVMIVGGVMFGLATAIGCLIDSMPLAGAVALGLISAVIVGTFTAIAMEKGYYEKGKHIAHDSEGDIEEGLKDFRNSYGTAAYFFHGFFNFLPSAFEKYFMGGSDFDIVYTIGTFYFGLLSGAIFMGMNPTPTTGMLMTIPLAFDFAAIAGGILDEVKLIKDMKSNSPNWGLDISLTVIIIDLFICATIFTISDLGYIEEAFK